MKEQQQLNYIKMFYKMITPEIKIIIILVMISKAKDASCHLQIPLHTQDAQYVKVLDKENLI